MSLEYYKKQMVDLRAKLQKEKDAKKKDNEYIRQNEKCAFYKTKGATKFQKQQTPIAKVCCFF